MKTIGYYALKRNVGRNTRIENPSGLDFRGVLARVGKGFCVEGHEIKDGDTIAIVYDRGSDFRVAEYTVKL